MNDIVKYRKIIATVFTIVIVIAIIGKAIGDYNNYKNVKQELLNTQQQLENEKKKISKLDLIKIEIDNAKEKEWINKEKLAKMQVTYNESVWYTRCAELNWQLELKDKDNLDCSEDIEKYNISNIGNTKRELGL